MKPVHSPLALLMAASILLSGCAVRKNSPEADVRRIAAIATYRQAAEALASRRFTIELDAVFMPSGEWTNITNSFITMQGSRAEIAFSPDLLRYQPETFGSSMQLEDGDATLIRTGEKKNKYTEYTLLVKDNQRYLRRSYRMRIRLFEDTDRCDIQVFYTITGDRASTLRGRVVPLPPVVVPVGSE